MHPILAHVHEEERGENHDGGVKQVEEAATDVLPILRQDLLAIDESKIASAAREHSYDENENIDHKDVACEEDYQHVAHESDALSNSDHGHAAYGVAVLGEQGRTDHVANEEKRAEQADLPELTAAEMQVLDPVVERWPSLVLGNEESMLVRAGS